MEYEPKPQFEVREATAQDVPSIRRMHAKSWLATYPNESEGVPLDWVKGVTDLWLTEEGITKSYEHFKGILGNPDHFYRLATDVTGNIIGFIHGSRSKGGQRLEGLYLDERVQGTGLAQTMADELMEWFDVDHDVELEVVSYNERAKAFYRKYGFQEIDKANELFKGKLPNVTMVRRGAAR